MIKATLFLLDMDDFAACNAVWIGLLRGAPPSAHGDRGGGAPARRSRRSRAVGEHRLGVTAAPPLVDRVADTAARILGLEANPSGVLFGTITVGAVLAAENGRFESLRSSIEAALLVLVMYALVHAWGEDTASRLEQRRGFAWRPFARAMRHESSILRGALLPILAVLLAGLAGRTDASALWFGTIASAATLLLVELVAAVHSRLAPMQVLIQVTAGAVFGCVLLALHAVLD